MKKTFKVVILSTKEKSNIWLRDNKLEYNSSPSNKINPQHLYIISDDEIKEGDWYVHNQAGKLRVINSNAIPMDAKKVIATTDTSLHTSEEVDGSELMDEWQGEKIDLHTELSQLPESFIQAYIKAYNEGKPITEVDLEVSRCCDQCGDDKSATDCYCHYGNYKTISVIKTREDNTVIVHRSKMYSADEVRQIAMNYAGFMVGKTPPYSSEETNKWFNENL